MIKARIPAQDPENANLISYDETRTGFSWEKLKERFSSQDRAGANIIAESVDKWAAHPHKKDHPALIFESHFRKEKCTYAQLYAKSCQWAGMLKDFGFNRGDRLVIFLPPCPETFYAMAACARLGVLFCPIFSTSNFYEIEIRLESIAPRGLITHPDLVEKISFEFADQLRHILLVHGPAPGLFATETVIDKTPQHYPDHLPAAPLSEDTPLYLMFTSGSTRPPKGIIHCHGDMAGIYASAKWVLDLKEDTVLWTDADPAWVTGTVYGAFAPWLSGVTSLVIGNHFSAANWYRALEKHKVTTWYTTPRNLQELMESGEDLPTRYDLSALKHIAAVGAPLVPDLLYWVRENLKRTPHDNWWMTETGIICIANYPGMDIKPGSMGKPLPGIEAAVIDEDGRPLPALSFGELAIKDSWPGLMTGLWQDEERYSRYFKNGWFVTGDVAVADEEGYFYHQGRNDDLIKAGGDRVLGPFEIEQVLTMHPAVAEAAVISKGTEPGKGISHLKAFVTLKKGFASSNRLNYEIKAFLKGNLSGDISVKELVFIEKLPKTRSGKLLRRVLRAMELGLPGGDVLSMQD